MHELSLDELRKIQIEILDVVVKFCDDHEINYWLDCGTLIGAIRHKGYIPWDDDIDIGMLRPDYEKFMKLFNEENTRYKFMCYELDEKFYTNPMRKAQNWPSMSIFSRMITSLMIKKSLMICSGNGINITFATLPDKQEFFSVQREIFYGDYAFMLFA